MDVYEYAMQMEKEGESLYREGARLSANKGIARILTMLADAEVSHYNLFKYMKEHKSWSVQGNDILAGVKNIFVEIREKGGLEGIGPSQIELYRKAQGIEKKSEDFYREEGSKVADRAEREAFDQVAGEEKKHWFILQQMIDFVSRPDEWLENAEWYHLEEY